MSLPAPEKALAKSCKTMAKWVKVQEPFPGATRAPDDAYQSLFRAVVYQQLAGKAAATILGRVLGLFTDVAFPAPEAFLAMDGERLRGAGLSRQKQAALRDLAEKRISGVVPELEAVMHLSDEEIVERLTQVRGVGRWTVQMYLIFTLGRPDVWPHDDLGVRNGVVRVYGESLPPKQLLAFGERFAPYRSAAAWHFWRAADTKAPS
ncbi:MAG: DNA-3-methyladenine glycosylase family protein [Caulobacterales bacterium]